MNLISVVLGAEKEKSGDGTIYLGSFTQSRALLNWGFYNYDTALTYQAYLDALPEENADAQPGTDARANARTHTGTDTDPHADSHRNPNTHTNAGTHAGSLSQSFAGCSGNADCRCRRIFGAVR